MDQVLFSRRLQTGPADATQYNSITGGIGWIGTESTVHRVLPSSGKVHDLRVILETAPGAGKSWEFTLIVDGIASDLTTTISDTDTSGADLTNQVSVSAGQTVTMREVPSGTPSRPTVGFSTIFTGDTAKESVVMGNSNALGLNSAADAFWPISVGPGFGDPANELAAQQLCAGAGIIKNLYIKLSADPGTSPDAYRFTLRKNGASQSLTTTITANDTTGNDTVNSFSVSPGDLLSLLVEPLNTPSVQPNAAWSVTFVADTNGESLIISGSEDDIHAIDTEQYNLQFINDTAWGVGNNKNAFDTCVLRDLYINLENAPGSGKSYKFDLRISTDEPPATFPLGSLSVTIADLATTGSDTSNSESLQPWQAVDIQSAPAGNPTVGQAKWGLIMFIGPAGARGNLVIRAMVAGGFA